MNCKNCGKEYEGANLFCWNCGSKLGDKEPNTKSTFITLTCPSLSGNVKITDDMNRFACGHCGNEHIVRRSGGTISLTPVVEGLRKVQSGVDKTASELAIVRLKKEIEELEKECGDLEDDLSQKRFYWTLALVILALFVLNLIDDTTMVFCFYSSDTGCWCAHRQTKSSRRRPNSKR